jgi:L-ascorbate metabolism protein UlaG (beta-lactamase superfamily)
MVITYEGAQFVKITHGDKTIAFNPISKKSKLKTTNFGADIALITAKHPDFNGPETVTRKDKEPFIINGPGEYEVGSFFIEGFLSKTTYDGKELTNTIYTIKIDNMNVVFMGAISDKDLSNKAKESLIDVDILFIPIGGDGVLPADEAYKLAVKREPKMIIPIHFGSVGEKDALKNFLKEGSAEDVKPVDKLTVKARDLAGKEGDIVVIKPSS